MRATPVVSFRIPILLILLFAILVITASLLPSARASAASIAYGPLSYNLYGASHQQVFSVASQESVPSGISFSSDGSKMFVVGSGTDRVHEYSLSTNFDISTASFVQYMSVSAQDTSPNGVSFNTNGTKMFMVGSTNDRVNEYSLSTAYDLSTASYVQNFSVSAQDTNPHDVRFNSNGTKMFVIGITNDRVYEYNLGTGFDVSTASYSQNFSVSAQDGSAAGLAFDQTGNRMFISGAANDKIFSYYLSSAFNVSTASYTESLDVSFEETSTLALTFNNDGTKMFTVGSAGDDVNEYNSSGANGFSELDLNDGSLNGKIEMTLSGDTYQDTDADNILDIGTELTVGNIPSGLTPEIALTASDTVATLTLTGSATSHLNADDVADITFEFKNAAFTGGNASSVTNATGPASSGYGIDFDDSTFVNTFRMSISSSNVQSSDLSDMPAISDDGRYVAFVSYSALASGDTNGFPDVFVRDTETNTTTRVSVATGGTQTFGNISTIAISGNGRYVVFTSDAPTLVASDTNSAYDIFLHDRDTNTTTRVSVDSDGNEADFDSDYPAISDDGKYVSFYSIATNLVTGDLNGQADIFLHDTQTGATTRISLDENGGESNAQSYYSAISGDGRYIAFSSYDNLVSEDTGFSEDIYLYDTQLDLLKLISKDSVGNSANGASSQPSISSDGRYISYYSCAQNLVTNDTNGQCDIFLYDNMTDATTLVSVDSNGVQSNGFSYTGSVNNDGRFVAFASDATNLVAGDTNLATDIFLRDTVQNKSYRISTNTNSTEANDASYTALPFVISGDGKRVVYASYATNLVSQDTNAYEDIFLAILGIYELEYTAGSNGSVSGDTSQTVVHGEDGTAITATADTGYHFKDWSDSSTDNPRTDLNVLENITVMANFEADAVDEPDPEANDGADNNTQDVGQGNTSSGDVIESTNPEDSDSIPNNIENAAPNGGDANNDGIKDSLQNNVASFINKVSGNYAVLEVSQGCIIQSVLIKSEPEDEKQDSSADYPLGLMSFTIKCPRSGQTADIKQYFYTDSSSHGLVLRKYSNETNRYSQITDSEVSELEISNNQLIKTSYTVEDGGDLDEDGLVNQVIVDPSGLAKSVEKKETQNGKIRNDDETNSYTWIYIVLVAGALITVIILYKKRKTNKNK